jgi:DNA polymerase (family 10)
MTARIVRAMENPYVTVLGHVSGRLLLNRDPYPLDMEEILKAAARTRTAVEINADPRRLDIDWRFCRRALELGVKFSINPDAHSVSALANVTYGISMARKGWLTKNDIINCLPLADFLAWSAKQRKWKLANLT